MNKKIVYKLLSRLITCFLLFTTLRGVCQNGTLTIPEFKNLARQAFQQKDTIMKSYFVTGYYIDDGIPYLLSNMDYYYKNSPIPENQRILLNGSGIDSISKRLHPEKMDSLNVYNRSLIEVKINIGVNPEIMKSNNLIFLEWKNLKDTSVINFKVQEKPRIIIPKPMRDNKPAKFEFTLKSRLKARNLPVSADRSKVALLYSGGVDSLSAYPRYWNDIKFMYSALINECGFPAENIFVVYKDGIGDDPRIPVNFPATASGLTGAIKQIKERLNDQSKFFVYFTNHGGGYDSALAERQDGRSDENDDEPKNDFKHFDEQSYFYNQADNNLWDDSLTVLFRDLRYKEFIGLIQPCFGGGLIHDLRGTNRVLMSACNEFEPSWAACDIDFDSFSYHFTCAISGITFDGRPVTGADLNNDGKISMLEAFLYAQSHDDQNEHTQLEDSGDGIPTISPAASAKDGRLSAHIFLK